VSVFHSVCIDPSDLAEVAKSIAIEINNSLTAIVAHTSAALSWLNKGMPEIHRAKLSLDRIASAAFSAEGIISVYKSVEKGKHSEADLVNIRKAVVCALDELEHEFLEFDITSDCGLLSDEFVFAEPKQLHQALVNIISAALGSLKDLDTQKTLRILGEHHHHEFVVKISDGARPSTCSRVGEKPDDANYTSRQIKLAIANTLAHVQGGSLVLTGGNEEEKEIKLSLPNTKRQRYLHFM
jgi:C4-dicarboxylate-specific signal transduction histidine kinase